MSEVIAIIPARGGSKRIPNKGIIPFNGKPMIAWTIEAALTSGVFDKVIVSTDSELIAETAQQFGASVPFLRKSHFDDISPVSEATISALDQAEAHYNESYDTVIQLMSNCPLRGADEIKVAYENFVIKNLRFQISCFQFHWMNPWWAASLDHDGLPKVLFPEALKQRSQDLPDLFCPTGAIWIAKTNALRNANTFYGEDHRYFPMHWIPAMDIDTPEDLLMANAFLSLKKEVKTIE